MSAKTNGRTLLSKLRGVKHVTVSVGQQSVKVSYIKGTSKNWTTLDFIGEAASIMFQHVWFQGMLTESDNQKDLNQFSNQRKDHE